MEAGSGRALAARIARAGLATFCVMVAALLAYEFVDSAFAWSNGWLEGASYGLGTVLLLSMASFLIAGRRHNARLYLATALALTIPAVWCVRWTAWLLTVAPEIGPVPWYVALLPAGAAVLLLAGAAFLARRVGARTE